MAVGRYLVSIGSGERTGMRTSCSRRTRRRKRRKGAGGELGVMNRWEALRQQRSDVVDVDGDISARGRYVVTSDAAARQDGEDGQEPAERKRAVAAVGDGAAGAKAIRARTAVPSNQRASDSHDKTRLGDVEEIETLRCRARMACDETARTGLARGEQALCGAMRAATQCTRMQRRKDSTPPGLSLLGSIYQLKLPSIPKRRIGYGLTHNEFRVSRLLSPLRVSVNLARRYLERTQQ